SFHSCCDARLPKLFNRRLYVNHICCTTFDGCRVDCVVEIGGPRTIAMSLKALAVGAHVSLVGKGLAQTGAGREPLFVIGPGITFGSISVASRADFEKPAVPPGRRLRWMQPEELRHWPRFACSRSPALNPLGWPAFRGQPLSAARLEHELPYPRRTFL